MTSESSQPQELGADLGRTLRALVSVNRTSGGGELAGELLERVREQGVECREVDGGAANTVRAIRARAGEVDLVILGGGDGTVRAAAAALVETQLPLAILPLGTANDFARSLGVPDDPVEAARSIRGGRVRSIDVGSINGHLFVNDAAIGLSVAAVTGVEGEVKRRWGLLGYASSALRAYRELQPFRVVIEQDQRSRAYHAVQVSFANGRHQGSLCMAPEAALDDGLLDLTILRGMDWWRVPRVALGLRRGYSWADLPVVRRRGRSFRVTTRPRLPVSADGDVVTRTPVEVRVHPGALRVVVPG